MATKRNRLRNILEAFDEMSLSLLLFHDKNNQRCKKPAMKYDKKVNL